jgi:hypothetical protein
MSAKLAAITQYDGLSSRGVRALPVVTAAGERASMRFLEFLAANAANIRNPDTRRSYARCR